MSEENPLRKQPPLDDIAEQCTLACAEPGSNPYRLILGACFQSKALGIDSCIQLIDGMLHADMSQLTRNERAIMLQTLNNLRTSYAYQRELMINTYDKQV